MEGINAENLDEHPPLDHPQDRQAMNDFDDPDLVGRTDPPKSPLGVAFFAAGIWAGIVVGVLIALRILA